MVRRLGVLAHWPDVEEGTRPTDKSSGTVQTGEIMKRYKIIFWVQDITDPQNKTEAIEQKQIVIELPIGLILPAADSTLAEIINDAGSAIAKFIKSELIKL